MIFINASPFPLCPCPQVFPRPTDLPKCHAIPCLREDPQERRTGDGVQVISQMDMYTDVLFAVYHEKCCPTRYLKAVCMEYIKTLALCGIPLQAYMIRFLIDILIYAVPPVCLGGFARLGAGVWAFARPDFAFLRQDFRTGFWMQGQAGECCHTRGSLSVASLIDRTTRRCTSTCSIMLSRTISPSLSSCYSLRPSTRQRSSLPSTC